MFTRRPLNVPKEIRARSRRAHQGPYLRFTPSHVHRAGRDSRNNCCARLPGQASLSTLVFCDASSILCVRITPHALRTHQDLHGPLPAFFRSCVPASTLAQSRRLLSPCSPIHTSFSYSQNLGSGGATYLISRSANSIALRYVPINGSSSYHRRIARLYRPMGEIPHI